VDIPSQEGVLSNGGAWRAQETDRLAAIVNELRRLGQGVEHGASPASTHTTIHPMFCMAAWLCSLSAHRQQSTLCFVWRVGDGCRGAFLFDFILFAIAGDDWITITPVRPIKPACIQCYADHRIAMSFAVLGTSSIVDFHMDSLIQIVWDNQILTFTWAPSYKLYGTIGY
jgi:hypothetical protein